MWVLLVFKEHSCTARDQMAEEEEEEEEEEGIAAAGS
jgi:hypothetical protein